MSFCLGEDELAQMLLKIIFIKFSRNFKIRSLKKMPSILEKIFYKDNPFTNFAHLNYFLLS